MSIVRPAQTYAYPYRELQSSDHLGMWLANQRENPGDALVNDKYLIRGNLFTTGNVSSSGYRDYGRRVRLASDGETLMRNSVWYLRFMRPINPRAYDTRIFIDGAGGKLDVPRTYISGAVTAVIRYTLLSVDWDATDEDVDYDNQPTPAGDDPYVEVTLSAANGYQVAKRCSCIEFTNLENKDYYGIKAEVLSLSGYSFSASCDDVPVPSEIGYVESGYYPCHAEHDECTDPYGMPWCTGVYDNVPYSYTYGSCYVSGFIDGAARCEYNCMPEVPYWEVVCWYQFKNVTVTPMASVYVTVTGCENCTLRLYSNQPRTEVEVVSRSLSANYATLKTATPHGLIHYGGEGSAVSTSPFQIKGVDSAAAVAIQSTSRASNLMTITTASAHGLVVGDYVEVWSSGHSGAVLNVTAPVTANSFRVTSVGTSYTTRTEGGSVRKLVYDAKTWTVVQVIDETTLRYYRVGPNEAETTCSGKLIML